MTPQRDILMEVQRLEKASKVALPFTALGLLGVIAALVMSARSLEAMRSQAQTVDKELATKQAAVAEADRKLLEANQKLQRVERKVSHIQGNVEQLQVDLAKAAGKTTSAPAASSVQAAFKQAAIIDAALSVATSDLKGPAANGARPSVYGTTSIDLFYCPDAQGANKARAGEVLSRMQGTSAGRWRLRILAPEVNAREGYQIAHDLIRFNPDETAIAGQLKADIQKVTRAEVRQQEIAYPTPGYVSAFFCAAR